MEEFGFIILRHINNDITHNYWKECVNCIRKLYNEKIIVIDDNSPIKTDISQEKSLFLNTDIVYSEIPGLGEIYGYFHAWKYRPFKKFVVLHDSMFLKERIDSECKNIIFLWHFDKYLGGTIESKETDTNYKFISYCKKTEQDKILNLYYDKTKWLGCFGVSSIVKIEFIDILFEKYDLLNCIIKIYNRHDREAMERIFALLSFLEESELKINPSLLGNILTDYPSSYYVKWQNYIDGFNNGCKVIKIWSGR